MKTNKRKAIWTMPLLGVSLLATLTVGCTERATPPGFSSASIHLNAGETTAYDIDLSTVQLLTLNLHPRNPVLTATATGGTVTVNGQTVKATVPLYDAGPSHAGDLTANFQPCPQLKPGRDVEVRYAFTDASGQTLEQDSAVLGNVTRTCSPYR
ncbi:hypothetical protein [Deinococcus marmoris]|uniref:hypothetical protein n=1 Tax=Deinococcus marmoris TaxID=249408 RepID=UPI000496E914|nr:hypothetical protein [Deinococcus marmoris]